MVCRHPFLEEFAVHTGSQWTVLAYDFCHYLIKDPQVSEPFYYAFVIPRAAPYPRARCISNILA